MPKLLTRATARERIHDARLAGTLIDFALILQAEALEWAADQTRGLLAGDYLAEAARLRKEAE